MSEVSALLTRMGSEQIDLKRQIVLGLCENPFLDAGIEALCSRFSHPAEVVRRALDDLCVREVLIQTGWGGLGISPSPEVYGGVLRLAADQHDEEVSLRRRIYEIETSERLKQQLAVSQREVEAILEIVPEGVVIFDRHGHLVKSSAVARGLLGMKENPWAEDAILEELGVSRTEVPAGASRLTLKSLLCSASEQRWDLERDPPLEVVARPFSVAGTGQGIIVTVRDISERRAAEEEAARLREDFFSMIRHELLKPLLAIERALGCLGKPEWMEESDRDALFDSARLGMRRLKSMIDEMLLLARLERDPMAIQPAENVLIVLLLTSLELSFRERASEMGLTLRTEVPDEEIEFSGDERRIIQVMENLLDNALKFTPPGGTITLSGKRLQDGVRRSKGWVELSVADTGIGIPPDELERIFGKFYQVKQGPDRAEGLGLGLAICRRIVESHGGRIEITSKPGSGTTVRVVIPERPEVEG